MYHPGRVIEVFSSKDKDVESAEETTQATLEMWDENIITFLVAKKIAGKIKKGDIVLVDYRLISEKVPVPRHVIVKILKGEKGEEVWGKYKEFYENRKKRVKAIKPQPKFIPSYVG
jgi:hypothetical protein